MLRSILAISAGFATWMGLWYGINLGAMAAMPGAFRADGSTEDVGLLVMFLVLPILFSLAAGYITARTARESGVEHAFILSLLLLATGAAVESRWWEVLPLWYHAGFLGFMIPGVLVGARLRAGRKRQHAI